MSDLPGPVDAPDMMELEKEESVPPLFKKRKSAKAKRAMSPRQLESLALARAAKRQKREDLLAFGTSRDNLWEKMGTLERDLMDIDSTIGNVKEKINLLEGGYKTMKDLYPTVGGVALDGNREAQIVPSNEQLKAEKPNAENVAEHSIDQYGYISRTLGGVGIGVLGICAAAYLAKRAERGVESLLS